MKRAVTSCKYRTGTWRVFSDVAGDLLWSSTRQVASEPTRFPEEREFPALSFGLDTVISDGAEGLCEKEAVRNR